MTQDEIGIGAHTDYGFLTILSQDDVGGLQVRKPDGEWVSAPPVEGTFVINIGDLVETLTNGRYSSTLHRASTRPEPIGTRSRSSSTSTSTRRRTAPDGRECREPAEGGSLPLRRTQVRALRGQLPPPQRSAAGLIRAIAWVIESTREPDDSGTSA